MADDSVNVTITGSDAGASAALDAVNSRLGALEAAFVRTTAAGEGATGGLGRHAAAATGAGAAMQELDSHVRVATMGLGALGLNADAAAVKVSALGAIVEQATAAFGPMLAIGAGIAAIGAGFEIWKDGFKAAADF